MVHKMFPTFVLEINDFVNKQERKDILKKVNQHKKELNKYESLVGNAFTSFSKNKNFVDHLDSSIKKSLLEVARQYSQLTGFNIDENICNSWFNIQKEGSSLKKHTHPLCVFSGILYIKCEDGSFDTYFFNPNPMISFTSIKTNTEASFNWVSFKPKAGTLLLFPSWLKHGSNSIKNKCSERVIISFNVT